MLDEQFIKSLLIQTASRDKAAFAQLYALTAPIMLGIANRIVNRKELAEEVLQDVFVKIWHKAHQFDPLSNQPIGWIATMTRNRALDVLGSADVARVSSIDTQPEQAGELVNELFGSDNGNLGGNIDPSQALDTKNSHRQLRDCLDGLPALEKQSLALAYYHGLSHQELANHLAKPLGSVKTWVRRGMMNLKTCLEECMQRGQA